MQSFDFKDVTLEPGMLKSVLNETMSFYLNIPNDNIMKYMRESAGLPAPGIHYSGWYVNSRGIFLIGQWLSAFSRMYAISGNEAFRDKALYLAEEFWRCQEGALEKAPLLTNRSHYDLDKLLRAHCDLFLYCGYEKARERAAYLVEFADRELTRDNLFGDNSTEWYTLSESFLDAYHILGIEEALPLAKRYEYREFWDLFYQDADPFSKRPVAGLYSEYCHAYSHVNSFSSCAASYAHSRDPYYLKALRTFYEFMQREEVMATGGYGPNYEHLMPKYRIIDALRTGHDSFETQCDSYAAYRLSKYLTCFTGEAQFGHWTESLLYNATAATIPMTEDGKVIYYSDYNMYGARKINRQDGWTCCTGTRPLLVAEMQRLIYFEENGDLFLSQYTPSSLTWRRNGDTIAVRQSTAFPESETVLLSLSMDAPAEFTLHLRMPRWLSGPMTLSCNGEPLETTVDKKGWLTVRRTWQDADKLVITLPSSVWMHSFDPVKGGPNAFLHGPIVLAAEYTGLQTPNDWMDVQALTKKMRPVPGAPLHYSVEGRSDISFRPFYEVQENERYFLYHDTTAHATKLHQE
ncbi:MAG: glycoside hydrolase family 127 protein [Eubacteriales bacterium]|nr:glycoside hydrolase family 127 protein [Eubacteriales bacterium]